MGAASDRAGLTGVTLSQPGAARQPTVRRWAAWLEALGVVLSPAAAALVLRLRLMAPSALPDPAMHTIYIVDPSQVFTRYAAFYAPTARLREGARVGFLVPARLAYLAFGPVGGFLVIRYLFALIAVCPVYLLLRRLYGRPAGVAGILVVLSSPVLITAWGTDYPDSAVVAYATGALACLAMPCARRWRRAWLASAGVLLALAVWSHGIAVPLAGVMLVGYLGVRLLRDRSGLLVDLTLLAGVMAVVTSLLLGASAVVFGHADFIALTWQSVRYLSQPSQVAIWHSASWRWAPYVAYVLVPPATVGAFFVSVTRRGHAVPTPLLLVGVAGALQVALYAWLQFGGNLQTLEHYSFSSTLWPVVCLMFAIIVAELARPLSERPLARWLPAAVLLAVPLGYEIAPHVPPFGWLPAGAVLAAAMIAAAAAARLGGRLRHRWAAATAIGLSLCVLTVTSLILTVAPIPRHPRLPGTLSPVIDPPPPYATALGGSDAIAVDQYRIATALPAFVGPPAYTGEQVVMWWPRHDIPAYVEYSGMYHSGINSLTSQPPALSKRNVLQLHQRRPAELLLFDSSGTSFPTALRKLAPFRPHLVRADVLRAGPVTLHVWLIRLGLYYHP